MKCSMYLPLSLLFCLCSYIRTCFADNAPLQDICPTTTQIEKNIFINGFLCKNPNNVTASDFKTSRLNHSGDTDNFLRSSVDFVTAAEFPGLNTMGLSVARTDMAVDGMVQPHYHPRASEMFYVSRGVIIAGFIDTRGRLFQQHLKEGDVFVFPRGLLHFCLNAGFDLATAFSVLNSQNPGVMRLADAMFLTDSDVLQKLMKKMIGLSAMELGHMKNTTLMGLEENVSS
ncbi:germin-like protein 11-1 isoform X3 [Tasmannia lanceolata]|uniref:germin-like protein 11-1 isoform X3 n=1 Tax=Tasmannia lanceolata TaxID=3420 RepID=UPI0040638C26